MEPPPASLEALVRQRPRAPISRRRDSRWLWAALLVVVFAAVMYYLGLRHH